MIIEITPLNSANYKSQHIAMGYFDGIHKSHLKVFAQHDKMDVFLFANVPSKNNELYNLPSRIMQLDGLENVGNIFIYNVKKYNLSSLEFVNMILQPMGVTDIYAGKEYVFGNDQEYLWKYENFFKLHLVEEDQLHTKLIKTYLHDKFIHKLNNNLIVPYYRITKIVKGNGGGAKLGFPTANSNLDTDLVEIPDGVYYTNVWYNKKLYDAVTFVGIPGDYGFGASKNKRIETHILQFKGKLLGHEIHTRFVQYISDVKEFGNAKELKSAIKQYIEIAEMLSENHSLEERKAAEVEIQKIHKSLDQINKNVLSKYNIERDVVPTQRIY